MRVEIFNISNFVYSKLYINKRQGTNHINSKKVIYYNIFYKNMKIHECFYNSPSKKKFIH